MTVGDVLNIARGGLYLLTVVASFALAMNLGTLKHKLAQWLSVAFCCWGLNAALWWAVLRYWMVEGDLPIWHPWAATINALFQFLAPVVIWFLFGRAMNGDGKGKEDGGK